MTRKIYILLLLVFGFLLGPNQIFAHNDGVKSCCSKEMTTMDCCKDKSHHSSGKAHDCSSNCQQKSCVCPATSLCGFTVILNTDPSKLSFEFKEPKQTYYYTEKSLSAIAIAIWQPPKIA